MAEKKTSSRAEKAASTAKKKNTKTNSKPTDKKPVNDEGKKATAVKEKKQADILAYFASVIGEFDGLIPYERIHNPKWLNVSVRMPAVQADIDKVIENARNAVVAIEALHSEDEETLKAYYKNK